MSWSRSTACAPASCRYFTSTRKRRNNFSRSLWQQIKPAACEPPARDQARALRLPALLPGRGSLAVDEDEGDAAGLLAVINPGVIGGLLHQHVASLHMDLAVVEQHVDLAVEHDCVIHGPSTVCIGVPAITLGRGIDAHRDQDLMMIDRSAARLDRREIDDAKHRAVGR